MKKFILIALAMSMLLLASCTEMVGKEIETTEVDLASTTVDGTQAGETTAPSTADATEAPTEATGQHAKIFDQAALEEVLRIFQEKFAMQEFTKVQFDRDNGRYYFKVESQKDGQEFELKVDADTNEIVKEETDSTTDQDLLFTMADVLKPEEAFKQATKAIDAKYVPYEWQLDYDNNVLVYEFKCDVAGSDVEVKVDAKTGDLIKIDD